MATSPFRYSEPLTRISAVTLGQPVTIELPTRKRISCVNLTAVVTMAALGNGVTGVPLPAHALGEIRVNIGGNTNRKRTAAQLFGATGLNALNRAGNGGTVAYTQAGNGNLSPVPVLIGSADDTAQKALLAANTITVASFQLPLIFAEDFRKQYGAGEVMALVTGFDNGAGIGAVVIDADVPAAANITNVAITASYEYDDLVAKAGSPVLLSKEKILSKQYAAAGDIEVGDQIENKEVLQRVSLLTTADHISKVVVKMGSRTLRNVTFTKNACDLRRCGLNGAAIVNNRFDIEFDINDDPNSAPVLDPNAQLSILATLDTANDASKNILILTSTYGAIE